jgi:hypothetical protein
VLGIPFGVVESIFPEGRSHMVEGICDCAFSQESMGQEKQGPSAQLVVSFAATSKKEFGHPPDPAGARSGEVPVPLLGGWRCLRHVGNRRSIRWEDWYQCGGNEVSRREDL